MVAYDFVLWKRKDDESEQDTHVVEGIIERKRRKEMKDLFDELRDQLPADRGMKASKWEILSKGE